MKVAVTLSYATLLGKQILKVYRFGEHSKDLKPAILQRK